TLAELSEIFKVFDGGGTPCRQVRNLAAAKLDQIETHLQEVIVIRNELRKALEDWDKRLVKTPAGQRAGLVKALAGRKGLPSSTDRLLRKPSRKRKDSKHE